jgi:adenosylcobinamide-GDP ribazoletransferase
VTSLRLAVGLFTVFPVRTPNDPDRTSVRNAIVVAPLVGLLLGLLGAAVLALGRIVFAHGLSGQLPTDTLGVALAAALAVATVELASGGLHLDGLADTADGVAARGDRDRTLTVMQDPRIGAVGATTVALVLLVAILALGAAVMRGHGTEAIVTSVLAGRVAIVWGCTLPAARPVGLGAWVSGCVGRGAALAVTVVALAVPALLSGWDDDASRRATAVVMAALPLALVATALLLGPVYRRLGGITGDVLGAACVLATTVSLVVVAAAP